jgi:hypothetical protein
MKLRLKIKAKLISLKIYIITTTQIESYIDNAAQNSTQPLRYGVIKKHQS